MVLLALCLLTSLASATLNKSYSVHATRLRRHLLSDHDPVVPPSSDRHVNYSKAGTDVGLSIRFFKVQAVDASAGHMRLKVWVRMRWMDERLSWDPAAFGNVTEVHFWAGDATDREQSEIWVPDVQLFNSNVGTQASLDRGKPVVYSDGSIFWSRPGLLDALCKFSGLVAFPFDSLKCAMEWGGWSLSDGFQGLSLTESGFDRAHSEDTAGMSYQEYSIKGVSVDVKTTYYDVSPEHPWSIVKYTVELYRASFYYSLLIILPTLLITYLSFGVFFMSHEVGERLSFGITLLLVVEVMKATVAAFVPVCGELLWIDLFMLVNTVFCCISLLETMAVLFFAFHVDEHLLPDWLAWLTPWILCRPPKPWPVESQAGSIYRRLVRGMQQASDLPVPKTKSDMLVSSISKIAREIREGKMNEPDTAKLIFFEHIFYMLSSENDGKLGVEDACQMLSFVHLGMSKSDLGKFLADKWPGSQSLDCSAFVETCLELMWVTPFEEIKMGAENFHSSQMRHTQLHARYWLSWSKAIDRWSRFWIPMLYTVALGILFNLDFTDEYLVPGTEMFEGPGPIYMSVAGVFRMLVVPFLAVVSVVAWVYMKRRSKHQFGRQVEPEREAEDQLRPIVPRWTLQSPPLVADEVD